MMSRYNSASEVIKFLGISAQKLYYWRKTGKISFKEVANRTYLYDLSLFKDDNTKKNHILYARVSNSFISSPRKNQKDELTNVRVLSLFHSIWVIQSFKEEFNRAIIFISINFASIIIYINILSCDIID